MTKTNTKKKFLITTGIVVALILMAAIFYFATKTQQAPEGAIEDVYFEETISGKVDRQGEDDKAWVPKEHISEFQEVTDGFNAIGISWEEQNAGPNEIEVYIRGRNKGEVTEWYKVEKDLDKQTNEGVRYAAETPVIIDGDAYQYKVIFARPENSIKNIEVNIIDTTGSFASRFSDKVSRIMVGRTAAAPTVISRNEWGGTTVNASATLWPPEYAQKSSKIIVHHTAGSNNPSDPAAAVRAIWSYHAYTRDWGDIGYNYLVDQYGRVYEGRLGGNNVIAGHAAPYNLDEGNNAASIGVSVLGDFTSYNPNQGIINGLANIIGYKSYVNNINPLGTSYFENKNTYNVAGHKNYTSTACPGERLYSQLGNIRSLSNSKKLSFASSDVRLNSFSANYSKITSGTEVEFSYELENVSSSDVVLTRVKVDGRYPDGSIVQTSGHSNITLSPGQKTTLLTDGHRVGLYGDYDYWVSLRLNGSDFWFKPSNATNVTNHRDVSVVRPDPKYISLTAFDVTPSVPSVGGTVTSAYSIRNGLSYPITLSRLKTDGRYEDGSIYSFGGSSLLTINPGQTRNFSETKTISKSGDYSFWVSYYYPGSNWLKPTPVGGVSVYDNVSTEVSGNLRLTLFNIDYTKISQSTEVTFSYVISNTGSYSAVIPRLKVDGRDESGNIVSTGGRSNITVSANGNTGTIQEKIRLTKWGSYDFWVAYKLADEAVWRKPSNATNVTNHRDVSVVRPDPKYISLTAFDVTPSVPSVGGTVTSAYSIRNGLSYPITLSRLKTDGRYEDGSIYSFGGSSLLTINPGQTRNFSETKTISKSGDYSFWVSYYYPGSNWLKPTPVGGVSVYDNVSTAQPQGASVLDGVSIPATTGRVGREQHLWLVLNQSATEHYNMSSTPLAHQNGMAGNGGSFASYGLPPVVDERYYINMRWNYTEWYEAPDGTCTSSTNGRLDTCTRNTNFSNKAWHWKKRVIVTNPSNGKKVVCSVIEAGPAIWTGRVSGLSPEALGYLGAVTDSTLNYAWSVNQTIPLGPLN